MSRYLMSLAMLLSVMSITPVVSLGQAVQTKQEKKTARVKERIQKLGTGGKAKIELKTYDGEKYQGYLSSASADDFTVIDKGGTPHAVRYAEVDKIGGKNLSTGAKIAIGIGIGAVIFAIIAAHSITHFEF